LLDGKREELPDERGRPSGPAIIVSLGKVGVTFSDFSGQRGVFTIDHAPFISKPSDLTVENISKLIDMAIDHA
jgi:hypothetical protein